jgi:hypothetical protein
MTSSPREQHNKETRHNYEESRGAEWDRTKCERIEQLHALPASSCLEEHREDAAENEDRDKRDPNPRFDCHSSPSLLFLRSSHFAIPLFPLLGTSAMPHFGHFPGPSCSTSGCIGQVY